jgi:hypothetical protein
MTYDLFIGIIALFLAVSYIIVRIVDIANSSCAELDTREKRGCTLFGFESTKPGEVAPCCVCGRVEASFELPETTDKFCWGCSADFASIIVLAGEINTAKLAGVDPDELQSELCSISRRMLDRSQREGELGYQRPFLSR